MDKRIKNSKIHQRECGIVRNLSSMERVFLKFVSNNNAIPISIVRFEHRFNNELFKKAISVVSNHNELLRSCISKINGEDCINYTNHTSVRYEYRESDIPILHTGIDISDISGKDSFILSIILNNQSKCSDVATCFNHVLFDGVSFDYLMNDIYKTYISLADNKVPTISEKQINLKQIQINDLNISNKLITEYFFNSMQRSYNIYIKTLDIYSQINIDNFVQYLKNFYHEIINYLYSVKILEGDSSSMKILCDDYLDLFKDYQVNNFDKLKFLRSNSDCNKKTFLTTISFSRELTSILLKNIETNDITLFSYICSLLSNILHKNYSTYKTQNIQIQTYLNLRYLKHFDYSWKPQGLLILPLLFNTTCSDNSYLWEQGKEIFEYLSNITKIANPSTINEIHRNMNILSNLFYKNYLDFTKFDSKYLDIMVNNLGVIRQYESLKINQVDHIIHNETDLIPKLLLYFYILKGELYISLSSAYIHKSNHDFIIENLKNQIQNI